MRTDEFLIGAEFQPRQHTPFLVDAPPAKPHYDLLSESAKPSDYGNASKLFDLLTGDEPTLAKQYDRNVDGDQPLIDFEADVESGNSENNEDTTRRAQHETVFDAPATAKPSGLQTILLHETNARKARLAAAGRINQEIANSTELQGEKEKSTMTVLRMVGNPVGGSRLHRYASRIVYIVTATDSDGRKYHAEFSEEKNAAFARPQPHPTTAVTQPKITSGESLFEKSKIKSAYGLACEAELVKAIEEGDPLVRKALDYFNQKASSAEHKVADPGSHRTAQSGKTAKQRSLYRKQGDYVLAMQKRAVKR